MIEICNDCYSHNDHKEDFTMGFIQQGCRICKAPLSLDNFHWIDLTINVVDWTWTDAETGQVIARGKK